VNPTHLRVLVCAAISAPTAALLVAAGCAVRQPVRPNVKPAVTKVSERPAYVGSNACAVCHKAEFDAESRTHHAYSMRRANRKELGRYSPPTGPIFGSAYTIEETSSGDFVFKSSDPGAGSATIEYALGSGIANMTFVGQFVSGGLTEFRLSFNPSLRKWFVTPGQETSEDLELGTPHPTGIARQCVHCHASALNADTNKPLDDALGVGCESCHGPGGRHIASVHRGGISGNLEILNPGKQSPHEVNMACGTCHRSIDDVSLAGLAPINTARFQPYAIEISDCYRKGGQKLSCLTCHSAHTDVSTDTKKYESVCLSCHGPGSKSKICHVNPSEKCISCHMPQKRVLPGTKITLTMTDHLIWAYRPAH
jgi:hypothetical protein